MSWSRVLPDGIGAVNEPGLDFYDSLVDGLLAAGITPLPTLYHWDLPQALYDRGGWTSPEAPAWFAEYAGVLARRLGDRVPRWLTLNEPQVFASRATPTAGMRRAWRTGRPPCASPMAPCAGMLPPPSRSGRSWRGRRSGSR